MPDIQWLFWRPVTYMNHSSYNFELRYTLMSYNCDINMLLNGAKNLLYLEYSQIFWTWLFFGVEVFEKLYFLHFARGYVCGFVNSWDTYYINHNLSLFLPFNCKMVMHCDFNRIWISFFIISVKNNLVTYYSKG